MNHFPSNKPIKLVNFKFFIVMKHRALIATLLLLFSFVGIHAQDKCPNVVVVRKTLYDSFQNAKANVESLERALTKAKVVRDDLYRQFRNCEHQGDIGDMLKQKDDEVKNLEANLKTVTEGNKVVDQEIRRILHDANDVPVVYRYYDGGYGNFGRVWTMTFTAQNGKIVIVPTYYQLPDPVASNK